MPESPHPAPMTSRPDPASNFPTPTLSDWRKEVTRLLKGAPFEQVMQATTPEGIALCALYTSEDTAALDFPRSLPGEAPFTRGAHLLGHRLDPWEVAQEIPRAEAGDYNQALRQDLAAGQTAIVLGWDAAGRAGSDPDATSPEWIGRGGTSIITIDELAAALESIPIASTSADAPATPVFLHAGSAALPAAALFIAHARRAAIDLARLRGSFGTDPLADALAGSTQSLDAAYDDLAALTSWFEAETRPGDYQARTVTAWGVRWREAGGGPVDELAYTLGSAVHSLRELERRGVEPEVAATRLIFGFAIGPQFLIEVAKLRAARLLWGRITEACGFENPPASMWIHARTTERNLSAIDPETNILRGATEAISALLGGCDSLTVLPFDLPLGTPSELARRLARNTQLVLRDESHLDLVVDAVGGAHAIEALTAEIAEKAWSLFREVEAAGGMRRALVSGEPQARIAAAAEKQRSAVASRREVQVGANLYPNAVEPLLRRRSIDHGALAIRRREEIHRHRVARDATAVETALNAMRAHAGEPARRAQAARFAAAIAAAAAGATLGELMEAGRANVPADVPASSPTIPRLAVHRLSEEFEALRESAQRLPAEVRARSQVLLACFGPPLEYMPRVEFTRSFFRLAGLVTDESEFPTGPAESIDRLRASAVETGVPIVVLVSTDARYPEIVPAAAAALRAVRSVRTVLVAGLPAEAERQAAFRQAGVSEFLHLRCDAPAVLRRLTEQIGGRA